MRGSREIAVRPFGDVGDIVYEAGLFGEANVEIRSEGNF